MDRIDIKLLEFLEPQYTSYNPIDVIPFMKTNLDKPAQIPSNENEQGIAVLRGLDAEKLIEYDKGAALFTIGTQINGKIEWWDDVTGTLCYKITRNGIEYLDRYRASQISNETNKSVKSTNNRTVAILAFTLVLNIANVWITCNANLEKKEIANQKELIAKKQRIIDSIQLLLNESQYLLNHHPLDKKTKK